MAIVDRIEGSWYLNFDGSAEVFDMIDSEICGQKRDFWNRDKRVLFFPTGNKAVSLIHTGIEARKNGSKLEQARLVNLPGVRNYSLVREAIFHIYFESSSLDDKNNVAMLERRFPSLFASELYTTEKTPIVQIPYSSSVRVSGNPKYCFSGNLKFKDAVEAYDAFNFCKGSQLFPRGFRLEFFNGPARSFSM